VRVRAEPTAPGRETYESEPQQKRGARFGDDEEIHGGIEYLLVARILDVDSEVLRERPNLKGRLAEAGGDKDDAKLCIPEYAGDHALIDRSIRCISKTRHAEKKIRRSARADRRLSVLSIHPADPNWRRRSEDRSGHAASCHS
jgi:hypothetical protein